MFLPIDRSESFDVASIQTRNALSLEYTRHKLTASELRSLSERRERGDDEWLQDSLDSRLST